MAGPSESVTIDISTDSVRSPSREPTMVELYRAMEARDGAVEIAPSRPVPIVGHELPQLTQYERAAQQSAAVAARSRYEREVEQLQHDKP